jgi:hypothetical protein
MYLITNFSEGLSYSLTLSTKFTIVVNNIRNIFKRVAIHDMPKGEGPVSNISAELNIKYKNKESTKYLKNHWMFILIELYPSLSHRAHLNLMRPC